MAMHSLGLLNGQIGRIGTPGRSCRHSRQPADRGPGGFSRSLETAGVRELAKGTIAGNPAPGIHHRAESTTVAPRSRQRKNRISYSFAPSKCGRAGTISIGLIRVGRAGWVLMDAKILLMFALLAPILILAAGVLAHRESARDDIEDATRKSTERSGLHVL